MHKSAAETELGNLADLCSTLQLDGAAHNVSARLLDPIASALGAESAAYRHLDFRHGRPKILGLASLGLANTVNDDYLSHFLDLDPFVNSMQRPGMPGIGINPAPIPDPGSSSFRRYYHEFLAPNDLVHHTGFLLHDEHRQQVWIFNFHRGGASTSFTSLELARTRLVHTFLQGQTTRLVTGRSGMINETMWQSLSSREREICTAVTKGLGNKQIAASLHISSRTVENHLRNIYGKLGIKTRTQLIARLLAR